MLTKSMKKTAIFTSKNHRKRSTKFVIKDIIDKSVYAVIKIFTELAKFSLLKRKTSRRKGYQVLNKLAVKTLPSSNSREKRTIFLDLDETLVHSMCSPPPEKFDFKIRPIINGKKVSFYVLKRPYVDELLDTLSEKYEIIVFTAGLKEYACEVIDKLDWKDLIAHRFYRDSCKEVNGRFVKDLSELGRDLKNVVIVDDNPNSFVYQKDNGILIRPFTNDHDDVELWRLIDFFEESECFDDMRDAVMYWKKL